MSVSTTELAPQTPAKKPLAIESARWAKYPSGPDVERHVPLQMKLTDIETALAETITKPGTRVSIASADSTPPPSVLKALKVRAENLAHTTGITDRPVVDTVSYLHTSMQEPLVDPDKQGPIRHTSSFTGPDNREAVRKGKSAVHGTNSKGGLLRLEELPDEIWNTGRLRPDVAIVSVSPVHRLPNGEEFFSLGPTAAGDAEVLNLTRKQRITGVPDNERIKLIAILNHEIPFTLGDTLLHHLEPDHVVPMDEFLPSHPHPKDSPESEAIANNILTAIGIQLDQPQFRGRNVMAQAGIGPIPNKVIPGLAGLAEEQKREFRIGTEVVTTAVPPLLDAGKIQSPVITTFALDIGDMIRKNPDDWQFRSTSRVNNIHALEQMVDEQTGKDGKKPVFVAVNSGMRLFADTGDVVAAQKPVFEKTQDGKLVRRGNEIQGGHGGQRVVMEAGHDLGFSVIGVQAKRMVKGNPVFGIELTNDPNDDAEVTTPGNLVDVTVTENGYHIRRPEVGDPEKDKSIREHNIRGLIGIAAPESRQRLTQEAEAKGLLSKIIAASKPSKSTSHGHSKTGVH